MIYGFYPKQKEYKNKTLGGIVVKTDEEDFNEEQKWHCELLKAGFNYNEAHDFYYSSEGALMSDSDISIDSLLLYPEYSKCVELGYDIVYGRPTPQGLESGAKRAIYCKNYQEILQRHRQTEQGKKEIADLQEKIRAFYEGVDENSRNYHRK